MRIDAYNQVNQVYQTSKLAKSQKAYGASQTSFGYDQLQISKTGQDYQIAKQAVAGTSDIREDNIPPGGESGAQMKERVANGSYNVDTEDFASKLLEKYNGIL